MFSSDKVAHTRLIGTEIPHDVVVESVRSKASMRTALFANLKKYGEYACAILVGECAASLFEKALKRLQKRKDEYCFENEDVCNDELSFIYSCCSDKHYDADAERRFNEEWQLRNGSDHLEIPPPKLRKCLEVKIPEQKTMSACVTLPVSDMPSKPASRRSPKKTKTKKPLPDIAKIKEVIRVFPVSEKEDRKRWVTNQEAAKIIGVKPESLNSARARSDINRRTPVNTEGGILGCDDTGRIYLEITPRNIVYYRETLKQGKESAFYKQFDESAS